MAGPYFMRAVNRYRHPQVVPLAGHSTGDRARTLSGIGIRPAEHGPNPAPCGDAITFPAATLIGATPRLLEGLDSCIALPFRLSRSRHPASSQVGSHVLHTDHERIAGKSKRSESQV